MGLSYLSSAFVLYLPNELYEEALRPLHQRFELPEIGLVEKIRVEDADLVTAEEGENTSLLDTATSPGGSTVVRRRDSSAGVGNGDIEIA